MCNEITSEMTDDQKKIIEQAQFIDELGTGITNSCKYIEIISKIGAFRKVTESTMLTMRLLGLDLKELYVRADNITGHEDDVKKIKDIINEINNIMQHISWAFDYEDTMSDEIFNIEDMDLSTREVETKMYAITRSYSKVCTDMSDVILRALVIIGDVELN